MDSSVASRGMPALMLGAIGVVYGDIGTSPLYAIKECFNGPHAIALSRDRSEGYVTVTLVTEKIAPRGKRPVVMAPTFCPLCGERYRPEAKATDDQSGAQVAA